MIEEVKMWGIHTWDDTLFLQESVIAIGWREMGDLSVLAPDRDAFREKWAEALAAGDPCYNPNLSLRHEDWRINP